MLKSMLLSKNLRKSLTYIILGRQLNAKEKYQQKLELIDDLNIDKKYVKLGGLMLYFHIPEGIYYMSFLYNPFISDKTSFKY